MASIKEKIVYGGPVRNLPNRSFSEYLLEHMRKNKDCIPYIQTETDKYLRTGDLMRDSVKLATILTARGIKVGDRVSLMSENRLGFMLPACAVILASGVFAPLNPSYTERELIHMLGIYKSKIIFVSRRCEKLVVQTVKKLPWPIEIIALDEPNEGLTTLAQLLQRSPNVDPDLYTPPKISDPWKQPLLILASSGTTGLPKGVTISHRNMQRLLDLIGQPLLMDLRRNDRLLLFLPFFHGYGFSMMLTMIVYRSTAVISQSFNPKEFFNHIQKYKVTHMALVPPVCVFLAKETLTRNYDFSSLRQIVCGAAPFPMELAEDVRQRLQCRIIRNAYGMTELTVISNMGLLASEDVTTVGPPLPGLYAKVVNPSNGETLGPGEVGELCFKGEQVMLRYWENESETAKTIDKDNWLHSGDLGYYNENGEFYVVGRLKELIKYNAYQVSPVELETILLSHPAVKDAAVVGKPDELSGELPTAFVVKQPHANPTAQEIAEFVNKQVSPQKRIRGGVKFIESIPKNPTGKIMRKELVALTSKL